MGIRDRNIEPIARAWCARDLSFVPNITQDELPHLVDRYWPVVGAEIMAGLRDDAGNVTPHAVEAGLRAWAQWLDERRHP